MTESEQVVNDEHTYLMGTFKRVPVVLTEGHGTSVKDAAGKSEYIRFSFNEALQPTVVEGIER